MFEARTSIAEELDEALTAGPTHKQLDAAKRITDLFASAAEGYDREQIALFTGIFEQLVRTLEIRALADIAARMALSELSGRLAAIPQAPPSVIGILARHDDISIAQPVLAESARLSDHDLIEIAATKSTDHLLAISGRWWLRQAVTDALLARRFPAVNHKLLSNPGSRISTAGFAILLSQLEADPELAVLTGVRADLPPALRRQLLQNATDAVRTKLLSRAPPHMFEEIRNAVAAASIRTERELFKARDFSEAKRFVKALKERGEIGEMKLAEFARRRQYAETVVLLAELSHSSIDVIRSLMQSARDEGLLVACKAADLPWQTVHAVLDCRFVSGSTSAVELEQAKSGYIRLSADDARRTIRFWQVHSGPSKPH